METSSLIFWSEVVMFASIPALLGFTGIIWVIATKADERGVRNSDIGFLIASVFCLVSNIILLVAFEQYFTLAYDAVLMFLVFMTMLLSYLLTMLTCDIFKLRKNL